MKRCPECRRDYYDDTLAYCLDDGNALLEGPAAPFGVPPSGSSSRDEPPTAILSEPPASAGGQFVGESAIEILSEPRAVATGLRDGEATRPQIHTTDQTAIFPAGAEAEPQDSFGSISERQSLSANRAAQPQEDRAATPQETNDGNRAERGKVGSWQRLLAVVGIVALFLVGAFFAYKYLAPAKQIESIAVMPFVNESGNADVEYLSDGMTETLIRSLSQLPGLSVKSRSSVFRYKGKDADAKTIGKELGVQAILNGRVAQRGDQLILNLELINAETENVIWTDEYNRKQSDLISLQNEIARDVSAKLRIKLSGSDQQKLAKIYTSDPEAYRLYLQGRFYWNKRTNSEVLKGIPFFKQAVVHDPNFALGYVGLADSDEDRDRAVKKEYIRRALEIDPSLAEAHASLGYQYILDYDWTASGNELRRAIELDPKYPQSYAWNGARLMMIGKYDEALASIDQALTLDPTANGINFYKGVCLGAAGRRDEAIQQFKKTIELDPTFPWPHSHLSRIYRINGDLAAAAEERAVSLELDGKPDLAKGTREAFGRGGWNAVQEYMRQHNPTLFSVLLTTDDKDNWIEKLRKQAADGSFWLFLIKTDPIFDPLRNDPRFQTLVHKFDPPVS